MNHNYLIGKTDVGTNDIPIMLIDKRHYFPYLFFRYIGGEGPSSKSTLFIPIPAKSIDFLPTLVVGAVASQFRMTIIVDRVLCLVMC